MPPCYELIGYNIPQLRLEDEIRSFKHRDHICGENHYRCSLSPAAADGSALPGKGRAVDTGSRSVQPGGPGSGIWKMVPFFPF